MSISHFNRSILAMVSVFALTLSGGAAFAGGPGGKSLGATGQAIQQSGQFKNSGGAGQLAAASKLKALPVQTQQLAKPQGSGSNAKQMSQTQCFPKHCEPTPCFPKHCDPCYKDYSWNFCYDRCYTPSYSCYTPCYDYSTCYQPIYQPVLQPVCEPICEPVLPICEPVVECYPQPTYQYCLPKTWCETYRPTCYPYVKWTGGCYEKPLCFDKHPSQHPSMQKMQQVSGPVKLKK